MPIAGRAVDTVPDLLAAVLARRPARPALTWLDAGSGARVELSVATRGQLGGQDRRAAAGRAGRRRRRPGAAVAADALARGDLGAGLLGGRRGGPARRRRRRRRLPTSRCSATTGPRVRPAGRSWSGSRRSVARRGAAAGSVPRWTPAPWCSATPTTWCRTTRRAHVGGPADHVGLLDQQTVLARARTAADRIGLGSGGRLLTDASPVTGAGLVETGAGAAGGGRLGGAAHRPARRPAGGPAGRQRGSRRRLGSPHDLDGDRRRRLHRRARRPRVPRPTASRSSSLDDLSSGHASFVPDGVPFARGSVLDSELLDRTCAAHDVAGVVHTAGFKYAGVSVRAAAAHVRAERRGHPPAAAGDDRRMASAASSSPAARPSTARPTSTS